MEPQRPQIDDDIDNQIMDLYNMEYLSNEDQELPFENKFDETELKEFTFDNRQLQSFDMLLQDPNSIPFYQITNQKLKVIDDFDDDLDGAN